MIGKFCAVSALFLASTVAGADVASRFVPERGYSGDLTLVGNTASQRARATNDLHQVFRVTEAELKEAEARLAAAQARLEKIERDYEAARVRQKELADALRLEAVKGERKAP